ncbi:hypothetical protein [Sodaliphilus sp.]|uniref:hypothetical protein n=1 Tax=Sodaliphilus sp. TaxID=2815818 RepID=UPI00388FFDED
MIVSKRGLVKVIILLAIVDLIAAFWYFTLRIESSGESRDLWHHDNVTENADTVKETSMVDTFQLAHQRRYFITTTPSLTNNPSSKLLCIKVVKARLPITINGNDSLDRLNEAIVEKAFDQKTCNITNAISAYLNTPKFIGNNVDQPYVCIDSLPVKHPEFTNALSVLIFPRITSNRLLVFEIDHWHTAGNTSTATSSYIHYDRVAQHVIPTEEILQSGEDHVVLALINDKIEYLNRKKNLSLLKASRVPAEMCVMRTGISFMFPPGEIAQPGEGEIEILVPHDKIKSSLSPSFLNIMNNNSGWWTYKRID